MLQQHKAKKQVETKKHVEKVKPNTNWNIIGKDKYTYK